MGEITDFMKTMVDPITKLFDVVQCAVGKIYEPTNIRKIARTISRVTREYPDINISYEKDGVKISQDADEFIKRTETRFAFQEMKKQANIDSVVGKTYEALINEPQVTSEPVDSDFMNRFVNCVQDVSSEELQKFWADLLADEIKQPGSFSIRTLNVLHNLTSKEANSFQRLASYVIRSPWGGFIPNYTDLLNYAKDLYADILLADECGLINSSPLINQGIEFPCSEGNNILFVSDNYFLTFEKGNGSDGSFSIPQYRLTKAGNEMLKICGRSCDDHFFIQFGKKLNARVIEGGAVILHIYKRLDQNNVMDDFDNPSKIEFDDKVDYILI